MEQLNAKNKGKVYRMLANKVSIAARMDAFGDSPNADIGNKMKAEVESTIQMLQERQLKKLSGTGKSVAKAEKYEMKSEVKGYNPATDSTLPKSGKKRKHEETSDTEQRNGEPQVVQDKILPQKIEEDDGLVNTDSLLTFERMKAIFYDKIEELLRPHGSGRLEVDDAPKGRVIHFTGAGDQTSPKEVKEIFNIEDCSVVKINFNKGDTEGYVQFAKDGDGEKAMEAVLKKNENKLSLRGVQTTLRVIEGDEENNYWKKDRRA